MKQEHAKLTRGHSMRKKLDRHSHPSHASSLSVVLPTTLTTHAEGPGRMTDLHPRFGGVKDFPGRHKSLHGRKSKISTKRT